MVSLYFTLFVCVIIHQGSCHDEESYQNYDKRSRNLSSIQRNTEVDVMLPDFDERIGEPIKTDPNMCEVTTEEICVRFSNVLWWSPKANCEEKVKVVKCEQEVNCWVDFMKNYHSKCVQQTAFTSKGKEYASGCNCELYYNYL